MKRITHVVAVLGLMMTGCTSGLSLYVATNGDDGWSGRQAVRRIGSSGPFATLERARDELRKLKQAGSLAQPVTVFVRGGTYRIGASLILGPQDSGTEAAPVVWQAAAGEEVRLCGGAALWFSDGARSRPSKGLMKKALIVFGGWDGHQPKAGAELMAGCSV